MHAQPRHGRQPRVQLPELPRVNAGLQDRLDPSLVLTAPHPELGGPFARKRREFVQEDPDVIRIAVNHVEQLFTEQGQLRRRGTSRLSDPIGAQHHLVHHSVVDGSEQLLLGTDVVVERAFAKVVRRTELIDARGVVAAAGENACRRSMIAWRRTSRFALRRESPVVSAGGIGARLAVHPLMTWRPQHRIRGGRWSPHFGYLVRLVHGSQAVPEVRRRT